MGHSPLYKQISLNQVCLMKCVSTKGHATYTHPVELREMLKSPNYPTPSIKLGPTLERTRTPIARSSSYRMEGPSFVEWGSRQRIVIKTNGFAKATIPLADCSRWIHCHKIVYSYLPTIKLNRSVTKAIDLQKVIIPFADCSLWRHCRKIVYS